MSGVNKVIIIGHLGNKPELRYSSNNVPVLSFPLATTELMNKNDLKVEQYEWHNIVMWHGLAEAAAKVLKKGMLIYVEGKSHTRTLDDKNGKRSITEIIAENFVLLGRNSDFEDRSVNEDERLKRKRI